MNMGDPISDHTVINISTWRNNHTACPRVGLPGEVACDLGPINMDAVGWPWAALATRFNKCDLRLGRQTLHLVSEFGRAFCLALDIVTRCKERGRALKHRVN